VVGSPVDRTPQLGSLRNAFSTELARWRHV
jgi:hypothetical protein